jgi:hypothetical protein
MSEEIKRIEIDICDDCLSGDGEVCSTPGCALIWHAVDLPIDGGTYLIVDTDRTAALESELAAVKHELNNAKAAAQLFEAQVEELERAAKETKETLAAIVEGCDCSRFCRCLGGVEELLEVGAQP